MKKYLFWEKVSLFGFYRSYLLILLLILFVVFAGCELLESEKNELNEKANDKEESETSNDDFLDVEIRAAFTEDDIAFNFEWESMMDYPLQFQDIIRFDGEKWEDVPGDEQHQETKISLMIEDPDYEVEGFEEGGCYVTCHDDMNNEVPGGSGGGERETTHYLIAEDEKEVDEFGLDKWVWRGAKTAPMDFAEDKWISRGEFGTGYSGRRRDYIEQPPVEWIKENEGIWQKQPVNEVSWQEKSLPRYVFNPEKVSFDNYFYSCEEGEPYTDPVELMESVHSMEYEPLKVIYQDYDFAPEDDRVNVIDVKFLQEMAQEKIKPGLGDGWEEFWSNQTGITTSQEAKGMLDDIVDNLKEGVLLSKNTGLIYESSQHDVFSIREYEPDSATWTVTLYREISPDEGEEDAIEQEEEEPTDDVDFEEILEEETYNVAFAVHDTGERGLSHYISPPYSLGNEETEAEIEAMEVEEDLTIDTTDEIIRVDWEQIEPIEASFYLPGSISYQDLTDEEFHGEGAEFINQEKKCMDCHGEEELLQSP